MKILHSFHVMKQKIAKEKILTQNFQKGMCDFKNFK